MQSKRQERKAKRAAEKQAALYKTTAPLTLADAFTPRGNPTGAPMESGLGKKQRTPGAFGRDKLRMKRGQTNA